MNPYYVKPKSQFLLSHVDPDDRTYFNGNKEKGLDRFNKLRIQLIELQNLFYVDGRYPLLIVFQALDTAGKDSVIRNVFEGVNPQGVRVASFKKPTDEELSHDYLWRIHQELPEKGKIVIFNRSHYEDVLVPRVHKLVPPALIEKRYDHIVQFERMLVEEGMVILKFYLHISKEEQKKRLQERVDDPQKRWKFNPADLNERKRWAEYQKAYEALISKTSCPNAPWHVIPANDKWYRNLMVAEIIVDRLKQMKLEYPSPEWDPQKIKIT